MNILGFAGLTSLWQLFSRALVAWKQRPSMRECARLCSNKTLCAMQAASWIWFMACSLPTSALEWVEEVRRDRDSSARIHEWVSEAPWTPWNCMSNVECVPFLRREVFCRFLGSMTPQNSFRTQGQRKKTTSKEKRNSTGNRKESPLYICFFQQKVPPSLREESMYL